MFNKVKWKFDLFSAGQNPLTLSWAENIYFVINAL